MRVVGIGLYSNSLCTLSWSLGPLFHCTCSGSTPWQWSQGYLVNPICDDVIFSLGLFCIFVSAHVLGCAAPSARGTTFGLEPGTGATPLVAFP